MTGKRKYLADYTMTSTTERARVEGGGAREGEKESRYSIREYDDCRYTD